MPGLPPHARMPRMGVPEPKKELPPDPRLLPGSYIKAGSVLWLVIGPERNERGEATGYIELESHSGETQRSTSTEIQNTFSLVRRALSDEEAQRLNDEVDEIVVAAAVRRLPSGV